MVLYDPATSSDRLNEGIAMVNPKYICQEDFHPRGIDYGLVNGEYLWSGLETCLPSDSACAYLTDLLGILADD